MIKQNKKVLVIRCGLLGDTVDATSVIEPLIEVYGSDVDIHWVSKPGISDLFKYDERINKVFKLKHTRLPFLFNLEKFKIILNSIFSPYDLILNLEIGSKFNDIVRYSRSVNKIGMPMNYIPDDIFEEHRVKHQLRILDILNASYKEERAIPSIIGVEIDSIKDKYPIDKPYIILCPTNSHVGNLNHRGYRSWPEKNWKELINKILEKTTFNIILVGSKEEKKYFNTFYPLQQRVFDLSGMTDVPELITLMQESKCVVATDSGSAHIAGASAKNIISIHGPTNSYQSAPYKTTNNSVKIASLNLECSPCYDTEVIKKCKKNICMQSLDANIVYGMIEELNL